VAVPHPNLSGHDPRTLAAHSTRRADESALSRGPVRVRTLRRVVNEQLQNSAEQLSRTSSLIRMWSKLAQHPLLVAHPLGGSVMAEYGEHGAVNHKWQVSPVHRVIRSMRTVTSKIARLSAFAGCPPISRFALLPNVLRPGSLRTRLEIDTVSRLACCHPA